jgi:cystathionine gamma-synthase
VSEDPRSIVRRSDPSRSVSRPLTTPLQPSAAYVTTDPDQLDDVYEGREPGFTYAREGHPNAVAVAQTIGWLEGADDGSGVVTGSGMAATGAVFLGLLDRGDHVVGGDQLYGRTRRLLDVDLPRMGFATSTVDTTDAAKVAAAIRPETRMILVEVVANPTLRVADIPAIAEVARRHDVLFVVDNTFTTPRAFRPLEHGADVVVHSVTKMLAGHSDVTLGFVVANTAERNDALRQTVVTWGLTPSPFDCWLAERGLHTFELRYDRAEANAVLLADHLVGLRGVEAVIYPTRSDHPDHDRAESLLGGRGGTIVSFRLEGGWDEAAAFVRAASPLSFAPTLGDVSTLISHPASSSHRGLTPDQRRALGITDGFIRLSVGIEDPDLLTSILTRALGG